MLYKYKERGKAFATFFLRILLGIKQYLPCSDKKKTVRSVKYYHHRLFLSFARKVSWTSLKRNGGTVVVTAQTPKLKQAARPWVSHWITWLVFSLYLPEESWCQLCSCWLKGDVITWENWSIRVGWDDGFYLLEKLLVQFKCSVYSSPTWTEPLGSKETNQNAYWEQRIGDIFHKQTNYVKETTVLQQTLKTQQS